VNIFSSFYKQNSNKQTKEERQHRLNNAFSTNHGFYLTLVSRRQEQYDEGHGFFKPHFCDLLWVAGFLRPFIFRA